VSLIPSHSKYGERQAKGSTQRKEKRCPDGESGKTSYDVFWGEGGVGTIVAGMRQRCRAKHSYQAERHTIFFISA